jgi:hypothetical protein
VPLRLQYYFCLENKQQQQNNIKFTNMKYLEEIKVTTFIYI